MAGVRALGLLDEYMVRNFWIPVREREGVPLAFGRVRVSSGDTTVRLVQEHVRVDAIAEFLRQILEAVEGRHDVRSGDGQRP